VALENPVRIPLSVGVDQDKLVKPVIKKALPNPVRQVTDPNGSRIRRIAIRKFRIINFFKSFALSKDW
jgi:hypothetical protein